MSPYRGTLKAYQFQPSQDSQLRITWLRQSKKYQFAGDRGAYQEEEGGADEGEYEGGEKGKWKTKEKKKYEMGSKEMEKENKEDRGEE